MGYGMGWDLFLGHLQGEFVVRYTSVDEYPSISSGDVIVVVRGVYVMYIYIYIYTHRAPLTSYFGELTFHFMGQIFQNMGPIWVLGIYIYISCKFPA